MEHMSALLKVLLFWNAVGPMLAVIISRLDNGNNKYKVSHALVYMVVAGPAIALAIVMVFVVFTLDEVKEFGNK